MKNFNLDISNELQNALLKFPAIITQIKNKEYESIFNLEKWMLSIEDVLKKYNHYKVAEIAALRSKIYTPLTLVKNNTAKKKLQFQAASEMLYELQKAVDSILIVYLEKVEQARDILKNLLMILAQSNTVRFKDGLFQNFVLQLWSIMCNTEQLKPSASKVLTLVSQQDAMRIIADEIEIELFK